MNRTVKKLFIGALLFVSLCVSVRVSSRLFSRPSFYAHTLESIDGMTGDVLKLTGVATVTSAAITLFPNDVATPIAEKIADLVKLFTLTICVLYAEKFLLPLFGLVLWQYVVPALLLFTGLCLLLPRLKRYLGVLLRIGLFLFVIWISIPLSITASDSIYNTYSSTIREAAETSESLTNDAESFKTFSVKEIMNRSTELVKRLTQSLAVMIAAACIVPLAVLFLCIWLAKSLLGVTLPLPALPGPGPKHPAPPEQPGLPEKP